LQILVENQGRPFHNSDMDSERKGLPEGVLLGGQKLQDWSHFKIFSNWSEVITNLPNTPTEGPIDRIPSFYRAEFEIPQDIPQPCDSFLDVTPGGFRKGVAFLNGHNLGRYWPVDGPQKTLYAPSVYFRKFPAKNELVLFALKGSGNVPECAVQFVATHVINATVH